MGQMKKRKAASKRNRAARKPKGARGKAKLLATPIVQKRRAMRKKTIALTVARGPVSPAAREIIRSTSANLDLALRRLADR
jgi:hypothetical protein